MRINADIIEIKNSVLLNEITPEERATAVFCAYSRTFNEVQRFWIRLFELSISKSRF